MSDIKRYGHWGGPAIGFCEEPNGPYVKYTDHAAELAALRTSVEQAWGIIANVGNGDWLIQNPEWRRAATHWRDHHWHPVVDAAAVRGTDGKEKA